MKLNLGSGRRPFDGYINLDIMPYPGADVADAHDLPFDDGSAEEIYAGHLLEHMNNPVKFLIECWRVLKPRGVLALVLPDITCDRARFADRLFGVVAGLGFSPSEMPGYDVHAIHRTFWSPDSLRAFVTIFGFEYVRDIDIERDGRVTKPYLWQFGQEFIKVDFPALRDYQSYLGYRESLEHG